MARLNKENVHIMVDASGKENLFVQVWTTDRPIIYLRRLHDLKILGQVSKSIFKWFQFYPSDTPFSGWEGQNLQHFKFK